MGWRNDLFIILKIYLDDNEKRSVDVPVTPDTVCKDVLDCVREPGYHQYHLVEIWRGCVRHILEEERPHDILQQWGLHRDEVKFYLRYGPPKTIQEYDGRRGRRRNGMNRDILQSPDMLLPNTGDLTLTELQDMASRQQQQIDSQQQVLVAKEQRLKFLKQQDMKHQQIAADNERLRKLREQVEVQELKLKKLRALRGQVEQNKMSNSNLNSELESIKTLFNEKEKELTVAVSKVEELTKQLEQFKQGNVNNMQPDNKQIAGLMELDKLRKELLLRNKLNEDQNYKLSAHRNILIQRKEDVVQMDKRISELQQRLRKKRSQQQLNSQNNATNQNKVLNNRMSNRVLGTNIAAVEPYIKHAPNEPAKDDTFSKPGFVKQDPKYQTLPPNTRFPYPDKTMDNNSQNFDKSRNMDQKQESYDEYKIPLVVSVEPPKRTIQNGDIVRNNDPSIHPKASESRSLDNNKPQSIPYDYNNKIAPKPSIGMSNLAPKPFGSTYSTANLPGKDFTHSVVPPSTNIQDEVRYGGSGQSSPATSDSSHPLNNTNQQNAHVNGKDGNNTNAQRIVPGISSSNSPNPAYNGSAMPHSGRGYPALSGSNGMRPSKNESPPVATRPGFKGFPQSQGQSGHQGSGFRLVPESSMDNGRVTLENGTSSPQVSPSMSENGSINGQNVGGTRISQNTSATSLSSGNIPNQPISTSAPTKTYRYAPKSVIANTYMGKLANGALDQYRKNMSLLYKNMSNDESIKNGRSENGQTDLSQSGPLYSGSKGPDQSTEGKGSPTNNDSAPRTENERTGNFNSSQYQGHFQPAHHLPRYNRPVPGYPQYTDIAADKVSYKANTPKYIRRKHSDSEDDLNKHALNNVKPSDRPSDSVLIDNMGNVFEVRDNFESPKSDTDGRKSATMIINNRPLNVKVPPGIVKRQRTAGDNAKRKSRRVSFDPLALLLDSSLEGELELVKRTAREVQNVSTPNDEGITALHNAICAGHLEIVKFLVEFGCDVNSPDSDGWTPLHCAASCNNLPMVKFLVEHGACIFATTISDHETAAEKCEEDDEGYDGCSEYLYSIQEKLGILNAGTVYAVFDYLALNPDELSFKIGDAMTVLRKGDDKEKEWWWSRMAKRDGYIPRNLLGLYPRVLPESMRIKSSS